MKKQLCGASSVMNQEVQFMWSGNYKVAVAILHVGMTRKQDGGYTSGPDFNGTIFAESRYHLLTSS